MAKNDDKALVLSQYAIMQHDENELTLVIERNLGTHGVSQAELDRVKVPTGGSTSWSIPTIDGEVSSKELDGVIVAWKEPRAYWEQSLSVSGGGSPPDCWSDDGIEGYGNPGGLCSDCPYSKFGSKLRDDGTAGDGQACRQARIMAILQQNDLVPIILAAPPTSLANMRKYFLRLASRGVPYYGVLTRFTLAKARSKSGMDYAAIEANSLGRLEADEIKRIQAYVDTFGKALERRQSTGDDFSE